MARYLLPLAWTFLAGWMAASGATAQQADELRMRFQREDGAVGKAKAFPKYGDAQLTHMRALIAANKFDDAFRAFDQYRDDALLTATALKSSGINAERKSGGFKQFQIHLRKSDRIIEDAIAALPFDRREPFEEIRKEIAKLEQEIMDLLFPRLPGRKNDSSKKKG